ncbi:MAG: RNA-binding protein [Candidatus Obscuribacterales bacterium]|nr:RNA-binding protein [Candidatus Obscuribacterales bacterium]
MSRRLLIGNLSLETEEASLQSLFSRAGSVLAVEMVCDPATGRKKGFAFVEMSTRTEALRAIKQLEGSEVNGRSITINQSEPRQEKNGLSFFARLLKFPHG